MPRPAKDDPRDCFKTFRFTEAEVARIAARARASGQTVSSYVRRLILEGEIRDKSHQNASETDAGRPPIVVAAGPREYAILALADQMRKVGTNLNQIARRMNELPMPPPRELNKLLTEIRAYVRQAREL